MKVRVQLTGPIVAPSPTHDGLIELADGATVETLLEELGFPEAHRRFFRIAVGDGAATRTTSLRDGDQITVLLPLGGG